MTLTHYRDGSAIGITMEAGATGLPLTAPTFVTVDDAHRLAGIVVPHVWAAAALSFQVSNDGVTFTNLYKADGTNAASEVTVPSGDMVIDHAIAFVGDLALALAPWRFVKPRSGATGAAVNQTTSPVLTFILQPLS